MMNAFFCFVLLFTFLFDKILTQECESNPTYEYYLSSNMKSFTEARLSCQESIGADLVMIKTSDIQNIIEGIIPEGTNFYLGMKYTDGATSKPKDYEWLDGTNVANCYHDFPDSLTDQYEKRCGVWYRGKKTWKNEKCDEERNYVCQQLIDASMPATTKSTKSTVTAKPQTTTSETTTTTTTIKPPETTTSSPATTTTTTTTAGATPMTSTIISPDTTTKLSSTTKTSSDTTARGTDSPPFPVEAIIGVGVGVFLIVIAIAGYCLWRKRRDNFKKKLTSNMKVDDNVSDLSDNYVNPIPKTNATNGSVYKNSNFAKTSFNANLMNENQSYENCTIDQRKETTSNGEYMSLDEPNKYETVVLDSVDNGQANREVGEYAQVGEKRETEIADEDKTSQASNHFLPFYSMVNKFQKKKEDATEVVEDPEGQMDMECEDNTYSRFEKSEEENEDVYNSLSNR